MCAERTAHLSATVVKVCHWSAPAFYTRAHTHTHMRALRMPCSLLCGADKSSSGVDPSRRSVTGMRCRVSRGLSAIHARAAFRSASSCLGTRPLVHYKSSVACLRSLHISNALLRPEVRHRGRSSSLNAAAFPAFSCPKIFASSSCRRRCRAPRWRRRLAPAPRRTTTRYWCTPPMNPPSLLLRRSSFLCVLDL